MPDTPVSNERYTRNERRSLAVNVFGFIVIVAMVLFIGKDSSRPVTIDPSITQELRQANADLRASQELLDEERKKTAEFFARQDSILSVEFQHTRNEITKTRRITNEKINRIGSLGSIELAREFAKLDSAAAE